MKRKTECAFVCRYDSKTATTDWISIEEKELTFPNFCTLTVGCHLKVTFLVFLVLYITKILVLLVMNIDNLSRKALE
jgi:hypothetical protein